MSRRSHFLISFAWIVAFCLPLTAYIYDMNIQVVDDGTLYAYWQSNQAQKTGGIVKGEYFADTQSGTPEYMDRQHVSSEEATTFHRKVLTEDIEPGRHYSFVAYNIHPVDQRKVYSLEYPLKLKEIDGEMHQVPLPVRGPRIAFTNPEGVAFDIESTGKANLEFTVIDENGAEIGSKELDDKKRFSFRIDNMEPGQNYQYQFSLTDPDISALQYNSPSYSFTPTKSQEEDFRFVFMSDSRSAQNLSDADDYHGVAYHTLQRMALQAEQHDPDFMIFGGDLIDGYTSDRREARLQFQAWQQAMAPVWNTRAVYPSVGNHDATAPRYAASVEESMEALWRDTFVLPTNGPLNSNNTPDYLENVYAVDYGNAMFLILNPYYNLSDIGQPGAENKIIDEQLTWLEAYLRRAVQLDYQYIIVASHTPAFPVGRHYGNSLDKHPEERDEFWNLLEKFEVDLYLCGHEHFYSRLHVDENVYNDARTMVPQITSGRAGAPPYRLSEECPYVDEVATYSPENNYVVFDVDSESIRLTTYNEHGAIIDEAEYFPADRNKEELLTLERERIRITRVIDGDTVEAEDGTRIRNIGIDAPEIEQYWLDPPKPGEPFGEESTEFVEDKILDKEVILKYDAERYDRFGRTLAYIFYEEDGELRHLEDDLIREGLSSLYTFSPHFAYTDQMLESQLKAMDEEVGIWSLDYEETADYYISSYYFYRFHLPDCDSVDMIELPYRMYHDTMEEALRKGLSPCRGCQPLDIMAAGE